MNVLSSQIVHRNLLRQGLCRSGCGRPTECRLQLVRRLEERQYVCVDDGFKQWDVRLCHGAGANVVVRGDTEVDGTITNNGQWLCDRNPADVDMFRLQVREGVSRVVGITFLYQDDGDAHIEVFSDGNRDVAAAQTKTFARGNSKQCIIIPAVEDGNGCSDNPADNRPCDRVFYLAVTPRSISPDPEDEKLDYALHVQNGEDCSVIPGDDGGAVWPRVMAQ